MTQKEIQALFNQHDNLVEIISNAVKTRLKEIGNKKSSELLNMKKNTISMFTNNKRKFAIKNLKKIAEKIF